MIWLWFNWRPPPFPLSYFLLPVFSPPPFALWHLTCKPSYLQIFCLQPLTPGPCYFPWFYLIFLLIKRSNKKALLFLSDTSKNRSTFVSTITGWYAYNFFISFSYLKHLKVKQNLSANWLGGPFVPWLTMKSFKWRVHTLRDFSQKSAYVRSLFCDPSGIHTWYQTHRDDDLLWCRNRQLGNYPANWRCCACKLSLWQHDGAYKWRHADFTN